MIVFLVGIVVSLLTGPIDSSTLDQNLFFKLEQFYVYRLAKSCKKDKKEKRRDTDVLEMPKEHPIVIVYSFFGIIKANSIF